MPSLVLEIASIARDYEDNPRATHPTLGHDTLLQRTFPSEAWCERLARRLRHW